MDWIARGGMLMWPIILFSVIALGVFLERIWVLRKDQVLPEGDLKEIDALLRRGMISEVKMFCQRRSSPIARIVFAGFQQHGASRAIIKENMEERGKTEALELKKRIGLLHTIASICPLVGLLGTVNGMIKVFDALSIEGVGNPGSFAGGISEALITTAAGLTVAIPAFLAQRYLASRAERSIHMLEEFATYLLNFNPETAWTEDAEKEGQ